MDAVESKWYEMDMSLNDAKKLLSSNIKNMSRSFIAAGYYMKYIRDRELFRDGGYNSIWEFAEDQYGIKKSAASRWMAMNDKFSKDGNSPILDDKYKDFNKSQLQEMLYLTDEQMEEAEPEMSAKEIRAIRKPPEVEVIAPAQQIDDQIPGQDSIEQHPEYMPGKMTIETATGQNRPPENEIPITLELQIERFFEALNRGDKERVLACDINATTYLLEARYQDVRIRNGNFNYQANSTGIMFNPGSYMECAFTWNELAQELIKRFGKKRKPVKMVSIDAPEKTGDVISAAVKAFCEAYPEKLKTIMRICRLYNNNGDAARAAQKRIAPHGYHGCTGPEVGYTFMGFNAGLEIEIGKEKVSMKYGRLITEVKKLYDPWDSKFDEEERCQLVAETPDEKQHDFVEDTKIADHFGDTTDMPDAWPPELKDIPIPTETEIMGYLYDEEQKLREILEVEKEEPGMPRMEIMRQQMITAGLRLIKNLVEDCREE
jgi:hypothetical protein|nr:MAG TPA: Protein of unknown function (DUF3102) [Caudoviricetes sp.]